MIRRTRIHLANDWMFNSNNAKKNRTTANIQSIKLAVELKNVMVTRRRERSRLKINSKQNFNRLVCVLPVFRFAFTSCGRKIGKKDGKFFFKYQKCTVTRCVFWRVHTDRMYWSSLYMKRKKWTVRGNEDRKKSLTVTNKNGNNNAGSEIEIEYFSLDILFTWFLLGEEDWSQSNKLFTFRRTLPSLHAVGTGFYWWWARLNWLYCRHTRRQWFELPKAFDKIVRSISFADFELFATSFFPLIWMPNEWDAVRFTVYFANV